MAINLRVVLYPWVANKRILAEPGQWSWLRGARIVLCYFTSGILFRTSLVWWPGKWNGRLSPVCSQELKQEGNNGGLIPSVPCGACPRDGAVLSSWSRVAPSLLSCFHVADETWWNVIQSMLAVSKSTSIFSGIRCRDFFPVEGRACQEPRKVWNKWLPNGLPLTLVLSVETCVHIGYFRQPPNVYTLPMKSNLIYVGSTVWNTHRLKDAWICSWKWSLWRIAEGLERMISERAASHFGVECEGIWENVLLLCQRR